MTEPVVFPASHAASAALPGPVVAAGTGQEAAGSQPRLPPAHRLVRALDAALRHILEIREFSSRPDCLLRISLGRADAEVRLQDGTAIGCGDPVVDLHLWNEQLPTPVGSTLARTNTLRRRMLASLSELARHVAAEPSLAGIAAVRGRIVCLERSQIEALRRLAPAAGFDLIEPGEDGGLRQKLHDCLENLLLWALAWTFNPAVVRGKRLRHSRCELWMSRDTLLARYGGQRVWSASARRGGTEGSAGALSRRQGR